MENLKVKNGVMLGLGMVVLSLVIYFVGHKFYLTWGSWIVYALAAYLMYKTAVDVRSQEGGKMSFGTAFTSAWIPYVIGSLLLTLFTYVLFNYIDPSLLDTMKEVQMEAMDKMAGMLGEEGIEAAKEALEDQGSAFGAGTALLGYVAGLVFPGAIMALIIGAITKKSGEFA